MTEIGVHLDRPGGPVRVGRLFTTVRRGVLTSTFTYDDDYVARRDAFPISPELPLEGRTASTDGLPGAVADGAPDRWGRTLIRKRLAARALDEQRAVPTVSEVDFLLGVSDLSRQGALRYSVDGGRTFQAPSNDVPPLIELPRLLRAADRVVASGADDLVAVKELLDAGSGSLGGARPKVSVRDGDRLWIAKFPHQHDEWDVMGWEKTALDLAELAGIAVPTRRLLRVDGRHVLLVERFDRLGADRRPYMSAMTLLGAADGDRRDYLEIAEAITDVGLDVDMQLAELWRRIAFSLAVNNVDDHLRNHGLLHERGGWVLSPIFDVNPNPDIGSARLTSVGYATERDDARTALRSSAAYFGLDDRRVDSIERAVVTAVQSWRDVAGRNGIPGDEIRRFADVFQT